MSDVQPELDRWYGRQVVVALYAILAIGASSRAIVQLLTRADEAPLPYALSAVSALTYVAATLVLRSRHPRAVTWARRIAVAEIAGVLLVGTASMIEPNWFPDASVWSQFGLGYAMLPLALPVLVLWLLRRD